MTDKDPRADGLDIAIGWLQKSIDELSDVTRRVQQVAPTAGSTTAVAPASPAAQPAQSAGQASPICSAPLSSAGEPTPSTSDTASSTTPLLDRLGRDLTALARQGLLAPVVGREEETAWVIETLLRDTKRNPVLLGPPGVGKTAIVEGLAQRIVAGKVPTDLKDTRIIEIPLAGLVAGTQYRGQLEERIQQLVKEASQPGIVLFLDEIHMLEAGDAGLAAALKPALARGDVAVIGATTTDDYRTTIAPTNRSTAACRPWRCRSSMRRQPCPSCRACATALPRRAA